MGSHLELQCSMTLFNIPHSRGSPASPDVPLRSPTAPYSHLILFSWCYLHSYFHSRWAQEGMYGSVSMVEFSKVWNNPNPSCCTARHGKQRLLPSGAPKTFPQSRCGHGVTIRWGTNCGFAGGFCCLGFVPSFSLSQAGPNSLSSAPAEAVQDLWSHNGREGANPCGMPECIPREQLRELHPPGLALIPLGAVPSSEIHPLQGASTAAMGNKGRAIARVILQE